MTTTATQALADLLGTMVDGAWTLRITNLTTDTEAVLTGWGLNTKVFNLYYASTPPALDGSSLAMQPVEAGGLQTVTITGTAPLLVFDLDVALESDTRQDTQFLHQLEADLQRASEFLFDWTNGQAALGTITVYHDAKVRAADYTINPWLNADVRIYATDRLRPNTVKGGVVTQPVTDTVTLTNDGNTTTESVVYLPGSVHMGAVWNRFGRSSSNLGEDWPRTLAHELGHYLLFLDDNYVGVDDNGLLVPVDGCPGAMGDHYRDDSGLGYGEFHPDDGWDKECQATLSARRSGRSDWATIEHFYPQLLSPDQGNGNSGPRIQPLALTQVQYAPLPESDGADTLDAPYFYLRDVNGEPVVETRNIRVFLRTGDGRWFVDLGRPEGSLINKRGPNITGTTRIQMCCVRTARLMLRLTASRSRSPMARTSFS